MVGDALDRHLDRVPVGLEALPGDLRPELEETALGPGEYVFQVLEPIEEAVYFDEAKLIAVDHPAGTQVYPHEMMAISIPPVPFELFCFDQLILCVLYFFQVNLFLLSCYGKGLTHLVERVDQLLKFTC